MTTDERPIERTLRLATSVDSLHEAWTFIMSRIDEVGPDPSVTINPIWVISDSLNPDHPRHFEVVVSGMVPEVTS